MAASVAGRVALAERKVRGVGRSPRRNLKTGAARRMLAKEGQHTRFWMGRDAYWRLR